MSSAISQFFELFPFLSRVLNTHPSLFAMVLASAPSYAGPWSSLKQPLTPWVSVLVLLCRLQSFPLVPDRAHQPGS